MLKLQARRTELEQRHNYWMPYTHTHTWRRNIDKAGGIDAYILNTPDSKLQSDMAVELRQRMIRQLLKESARVEQQPGQQQQQQQQAGRHLGLSQAAAAAAAAASGP